MARITVRVPIPDDPSDAIRLLRFVKNKHTEQAASPLAIKVRVGSMGRSCIVLDYSHTSLVAPWIRDEIREVSPGVYLGIVFWGKEKPGAHKLIHFALKFQAVAPK